MIVLRRSSSYARSAKCLVAASAVLAFSQLAGAGEAERREAFHRGVAAMSAEKWDQAFSIYEQLWDEERSYDVALSLGQAELNLKRYRDAAEHLQYGLLNIPPREDAEVSNRARRMLDLARKELASIEVQVDRTNADVLVDERVVGKSPLAGAVFVEPGSHTIEARLPGAAPVSRRINAKAGDSTAMNLSFDDNAPPSAAPAPSASRAPAPTTPVADSGTDDGTARTVVLISGAALTTIAAALTLTFALEGSGANSDADSARAQATARYGPNPCSSSAGAASSDCADLASALDRRATYNRAANASLFVTAVAGVATVTTFFLWPSNRPSEHALRLSPAVGPQTAGAFMTGTF